MEFTVRANLSLTAENKATILYEIEPDVFVGEELFIEWAKEKRAKLLSKRQKVKEFLLETIRKKRAMKPKKKQIKILDEEELVLDEPTVTFSTTPVLLSRDELSAALKSSSKTFRAYLYRPQSKAAESEKYSPWNPGHSADTLYKYGSNQAVKRDGKLLAEMIEANFPQASQFQVYSPKSDFLFLKRVTK